MSLIFHFFTKFLNANLVRQFLHRINQSRLFFKVGWSYSEEVAALEEKRKVRSATYFKGKVEKIKRRKAAIEASKSETAKYDKILAQYGML